MRIRTVLGFAVLSIVSFGCSGGDHPIDPVKEMCPYTGLTNLEKSDPRCVPPAPNPTLEINLSTLDGKVGETITGTAISSNAITCKISVVGATLETGENCGNLRIILTTPGIVRVDGTATGPSGTQSVVITKNITVTTQPVTATLDTLYASVILADSTDFPRSGMVLRASWNKDGGSASTETPVIQYANLMLTVPINLSSITLEVLGDDRHWPIKTQVSRSCFKSQLQSFELTPKRWPITKGRYAGQVIDVLAEASVRAPGSDDIYAFYDVVTWDGPASCGKYSAFLGWQDTSFPIPLALNRVRSVVQFSAADSIKIFDSFVASFNNDFGWTVFKASSMIGADESDGTASIVLLDNPLSAPGPFTGGPAGDIILGEIRKGRLVIPNRFFIRDDQIKAYHHELVHILGFGHTSWWPTIMCSSYPEAHKNCAERESSVLTAEDIGMVDLAITMRRRAKKYPSTSPLYSFLAMYQTNFNASFSP